MTNFATGSIASTNHLGRRRILVNIGALITGTALARGLTVFTVILLARQVGPSLFGQYAACMTLAKISSVVFSLGLDSWLLRHASRSEEGKDLCHLASTCLVIKSVLGVCWLFLLVTCATWINEDIFVRPVIALCGMIVLFDELGSVAWSAFQAQLHGRITLLLMSLYQLLAFFAVVALIAFDVTSLSMLLSARVIAAGVGCTLSVGVLTWRVGYAFDWCDIFPTLRSTTPFALSVALSMIYGSIDVIIVAHFLGSTEAGFYAPAATVISILYLIPAAIYGVMLPVLSHAHAESVQRTNQFFRSYVLASGALGIILSVILFLCAYFLVSLIYGDSYSATGHILRVLSAVIMLHCISFSFGAVLTAVGLQKQRVVVQAIAAFVNIGMNLWLIPVWGIVGAAVVFVFSEIVLVLGYWLFTYEWQRRSKQGLLYAS